jgi:hypothetical protein
MLRDTTRFWVAAALAGAALTGADQVTAKGSNRKVTDELGNAGWVPSSLFRLAR